MFDEQYLESCLIKLSNLNFQDAKQTIDGLEKILLNENLRIEEISYCSSKIFNSDINLLLFCEQNAQKMSDRVLSETKKGIYRLIAKYIKIRKNIISITDYLPLIFEKCKKLFQIENSISAKEAALQPIKKIIKYFDPELLQFIQPQIYTKQLLDNLKLDKLAGSVKGVIWTLLGMLVNIFPNTIVNTYKTEIQNLCFIELKVQMNSNKAELTAIEGMIKCFKYCLIENNLTPQQLSELFSFIRVGIVEIESTQRYVIIKIFLKLIKEHSNLFQKHILDFSQEIFDNILKLIDHRNKDVKEISSEALESVACTIAQALDQEELKHKKSFVHIMDKLWKMLDNQSDEIIGLTVIIRTGGYFSKAIQKILGQQQLNLFFTKMIEMCESKIIKAYVRTEIEEESYAQSYKTILFRQKCLISYILSYSHLIKNLGDISEKEAYHIYQLALLGIKQHKNLYQKYKVKFYEAFVSLIISMRMHPKIFILWIKRIIAEGHFESLKMESNQYLSQNDYYNSLKNAVELWRSLFQENNQWTSNSFNELIQGYFSHINEILIKSDLSYKMVAIQEDEEQVNTQANIQRLLVDSSLIQYIPNNPNDMQYFYRVVLLLDQIIPNIKCEQLNDWVQIFYRNCSIKLNQNPRSLSLLKLLKSLNEYTIKNELLRNLPVASRKEFMALITKQMEDLFILQSKYQDELLEDALKVLLSTPIEVQIIHNYRFFRRNMIIILQKSFNLGNICLGYSAIKCLQNLQKNIKQKILQKYYPLIIPCLSDYLSEEQVNQQKQEKQDIDLFNCTIQEMDMTRKILITEIQNFLGQVGGFCHLLVPSEQSHFMYDKQIVMEVEQNNQQRSIIAWDYEQKIIFPLPLMSKKVNLNLTKILPRVLEIVVNHSDNQLKSIASEFLHSIVIFMVGKTANASNKRINRNDLNMIKELKNNFSKIYKKVFPVILKIGSNSQHPNHKLFNSLCLQIVRWLSATKQKESPDIIELLEALMNSISSKNDNNLREFAAKCLGEFVKYTIKQNSPEELKLNHSNIKSTFRRIQSFSAHPNPYKRQGALLALRENINNLISEEFLIQKYILETVSIALTIAKTSNLTGEMIKNMHILVERQTSIILKNLKKLQLKDERFQRQGQFLSIQELFVYLYQKCLFSDEEVVRDIAFMYLHQIHLTNKKLKEFLILQTDNKKMIFELELIINLKQFNSINLKLLNSQCDIYSKLLINQIYSQEEILASFDFERVLRNIKNFLSYMQQQSPAKEVQTSLLDVVSSFQSFTLNSQTSSYQKLSQIEELSENTMQSYIICMQLLSNFDQFNLSTALQLMQFTNTDLKFLAKMTLKPQKILKGLNLDTMITKKTLYYELKKQLLTKLEQNTQEVQINSQKNQFFFHEIFINSLTEVLENFEFGKTQLVLILIFKTPKESELKLLLNGIQIFFEICKKKCNSALKMVQQTVQDILTWIKKHEENEFNNVNLEEEFKIDHERLAQLLKFALDCSIESQFVLSVLVEQSIFFQKWEQVFLEYIVYKWENISEQYLNTAIQNISLYKLLIPIMQIFTKQKFESKCLELMNKICEYPCDRLKDNSIFLIQEVKINCLLLATDMDQMKIPKHYHNYLEKLLRVALQHQQSILIHIESIQLLGTYIKKFPGNFDSFYEKYAKELLNQIRCKYFPIKIRELIPKSREEYNFKQILNSFLDLIKLSGEIQLFNLILPILRENLIDQYYTKRIDDFFKQYLQENYIHQTQFISLSFIMSIFLNEELDFNIVENARYAAVKKILIPMLENSKDIVLVQFLVKYHKKILEILIRQNSAYKSLENEVKCIQEAICCLQIIEKIYQKLPLQMIKKEVHEGIYGDTDDGKAGSRLSKELAGQCYKIRKFGLENEQHLKKEHFQDLKEILLEFYCSNYICLVSIIITTQNAENIFNSMAFLVKRESNEKLWELIIDTEKQDFKFEVQTNFEEVSFKKTQNLFDSVPKFSSTQILSKKLFKDTLLYSVSYQDSTQNFLPKQVNNLFKQDLFEIKELDDEDDEGGEAHTIMAEGNGTIEMDSINSHPCMKTILNLIDVMIEKFKINPQIMPNWMQALLSEAQRQDCPLGIQIFIIKIVQNRSEIFENYSAQWVWVLINYCIQDSNGGLGFHYFLRDTCTTILDWISKSPRLIDPTNLQKEKLSILINKLIAKLVHSNKELFKQNVSILKQFLNCWKDFVFIREQLLIGMLKKELKNNQLPVKKPDEEVNAYKDKMNDIQLWHQNALLLMELSLEVGVPVLKDFQEYSMQQSIKEKFRFYFQMDQKILSLLKSYFLQHREKLYAKITSSIFGRLFQFFMQYGVQNEFREALEQEIVIIYIDMFNSSDKTIKERYPSLLYNITYIYPNIMSVLNRKLFLNTCEFLKKYVKKPRALAISCVHLFVKYAVNFSSPTVIIQIIQEICLTLQSSSTNIMRDSSSDTQITFINLLTFFSQEKILDMEGRVKIMFENIFDDLSKCYQSHFRQDYAQNFYTIVISLHVYTKNKPDSILNNKVKASLLFGLNSQHKEIRSKIFEYLDVENNLQQSPFERLIFLLRDIYHPDHESNWLISAVPLLLSLSKKSSDYDRDLFDDQLDNLVEFYDWDFRDPVYLKKFNTSQPLTPVFTLTQMEFKKPMPKIPMNSQQRVQGSQQRSSQMRIPGGQLRNTQTSSFEFSQNSISPSFIEPVVKERKFLMIKEEGSQNQKSQDFFANSPHEPKQNQAMSTFMANNYVELSLVQINENKKIRYQNETQHGKILTKAKDINERQRELFLDRQNKARKDQINTLRKYRIGELPDIKIQHKDIIYPMIQLSFHEEEIAGELFTMLFLELFKEESREHIKDQMRSILKDLLKQTKQYHFNFISTMQKTMLQLCKLGELFSSDVIKETGIQSHSYHTSILLLEEILFTNQLPNHEVIEAGKVPMEKDRRRYWIDLMDIFNHLGQNDQIKGVLSNIMLSYTPIIGALDLKMSGQIKEAEIELSQILDTLHFQEDEDDLKLNIQDYLVNERHECLALLNKWEQLSTNLEKILSEKKEFEMTEKINDPERMGVKNMQVLLSSLMHQKSQHPKLINLTKEWLKTDKGKQIMEGPLAYEMALQSLLLQDIDRSLYYNSLANSYFIKNWSNYGPFAIDSKHEFLQNIQRNYELKEFLDLFNKQKVTIEECIHLFNTWSNRQPSYSHDSFFTMDQILTSRELYAFNITQRFGLNDQFVYKNQADWLVQISKGIVKKGLYGAADPRMAQAAKYKRLNQETSFNWDFYKQAAKLKLKQLEIIQRSVLGQQIEKPFMDLCQVFQNEFEKNKSKASQITTFKFQFLTIHVKEKFIEVYNDIILTEKCSKMNYENFASVLDNIFQGYKDIFEVISITNFSVNNVKKQALSDSEELIILQKKEYTKFAQFCERFLRILEGESVQILRKDLIDSYGITIENVAEMFVTYTLKCFALIGGGTQQEKQELDEKESIEIDRNLSGLIIKMIKLIQKYPSILGQHFQKAIEDQIIPSWVFINYIPQMMYILKNQKIIIYFEKLFKNLVDMYPESFIYQFNIIYEHLEDCNTQLAKEIFNTFRKENATHFRFIESLNCLTHPEHKFIHYLGLMQEETKKLSDDVLDIFNQLKRDLFADHKNFYGKYYEKFRKDWEKQVEIAYKKTKTSEKDFKNLFDTFEKLKNECKKNIKDLPDGIASLKHFSMWLSLFQMNDKIEIPGQYGQNQSYLYEGGVHEPLIETHVNISAFDDSLLTLKSIRRPKRITILGTNERAYKFLVKGIEDLRLDQRIEQLFQVINTVFQSDTDCFRRQINISTFEIIPMTKILGLLEWVDNTIVFRQMLENELLDQQGKSLKDNDAYNTRCKYINKLKGDDYAHKHLELLSKDSVNIIENFKEHVNLMPGNLLRNALERMAATSDAYIYLKNRFIKNYSVLCISGYLLGIGDRHLENFLVNFTTGDVVSIDFGISFGEGLNLYVPELMPFRLTNVFENLMSPIGLNGIFRHTMISSLQALKKKRNMLLDFCEIFISDPLVEWTKISENKRNNSNFLQSQQQQSQIEQQSSLFSALTDGLKITITNNNPTGKIQIVQMKLLGMKSSKIMIDELESGTHKDKQFLPKLREILKGENRPRSKQTLELLSVEQQVDYLIDHATDPNILGRTWIGWSPFI